LNYLSVNQLDNRLEDQLLILEELLYPIEYSQLPESDQVNELIKAFISAQAVRDHLKIVTNQYLSWIDHHKECEII
jgi:hypothetical protein